MVAKKTDFLRMRITPEFKKILEERSIAMAMTVSEYIRFLVMLDYSNNKKQ